MNKLKDLRLKKKMSQSQLAEKSGVNYRTLQFYEQNARELSHAHCNTVIKLAEALDCQVADLI
jgi:transcriptional regulator with XRE-family HTH domain